MQLVDTHCHIHFDDYPLDSDEVMSDALSAGVTRLLCVGCTLKDSKMAVQYAAKYQSIWASIGLHPHEAKHYVNNEIALQQFRTLAQNHARPSYLSTEQGESEQHTKAYKPYGEGVAQPATKFSAKSDTKTGGFADGRGSTVRRVVAIGETGLDYYYTHSPKADQQEIFQFQLNLAQEHDLPVIFHVRDDPKQAGAGTGQAFDDFFAILSDFKGIRGVVHSFTANTTTLDKCLGMGLYIGLNGIMTFTKDSAQLEAAKAIPLDRLLLETDAPFLTPVPFRGTICQPKHVVETAKFISTLRQESLEELAAATTRNAGELFKL